MSEWDRTWPLLTFLGVLVVLPFACMLSIKCFDGAVWAIRRIVVLLKGE